MADIVYNDAGNPALPCGCAPCSGCRDFARQGEVEVERLGVAIVTLNRVRNQVELERDELRIEITALRSELAERDDVIRELADVLRAAQSFVPDARAANGQWLCPTYPLIGATLARVDALTSGTVER